MLLQDRTRRVQPGTHLGMELVHHERVLRRELAKARADEIGSVAERLARPHAGRTLVEREAVASAEHDTPLPRELLAPLDHLEPRLHAGVEADPVVSLALLHDDRRNGQTAEIHRYARIRLEVESELRRERLHHKLGSRKRLHRCAHARHVHLGARCRTRRGRLREMEHAWVICIASESVG